jgi:hypothetical protein
MAIAAVALTACTSNDQDGSGTPTAEVDPEQVAKDLARPDLEAAITDRLMGLIRDQQLPYVVSVQPSFTESTAEQAAGTGLPTGTYLQIGFEFPQPDADHPAGQELFLYGPLELYAEAVRPFVDAMDFVVVYFLPWKDAGGSAFLIYPEEMRLYLDGEISVEELSERITIYGP